MPIGWISLRTPNDLHSSCLYHTGLLHSHVQNLAHLHAYDSFSYTDDIVHDSGLHNLDVEGMDVVDEIAAVTTDFRDMPKTPVVMKTVRVVE